MNTVTDRRDLSLWRQATGGSVELAHDEIAARAYAKYLQHQNVHGHHVDDWLEAERELLRETWRNP
jgi:Protein of unknown function (DUF2934)